jgi:hypothetical protein
MQKSPLWKLLPDRQLGGQHGSSRALRNPQQTTLNWREGSNSRTTGDQREVSNHLTNNILEHAEICASTAVLPRGAILPTRLSDASGSAVVETCFAANPKVAATEIAKLSLNQGFIED